MTKLLIFSGPSGAGKTTVFDRLAKRNVRTMQSKYCKSNSHKISSDMLLSKWAYAGYWFREIWDAKHMREDFLISDRSPLDSCAYLTNYSEHTLELTMFSMKELTKQGVDIYHVYMTADEETLLGRTRNRSKLHGSEAYRIETKGDAWDRAIKFYNDHPDIWHHVLDTSNMTPEQVEQECVRFAMEVIKPKSLESILK